MRNIFTIASREYKLYFSSPAAYLIMFFIFLVLGLSFYFSLSLAAQQGFAPGADLTISPLAFLLMLATPAVTTRLLAEEQRMGTIELLLTAPVRDWELVMGKWLGAFLFLLTLSGITLVYPIILNRLVQPGIDQGPLVSGYLGLVLFCATAAAIGVVVSSLFSSQVAAFMTTLGVMMFFWWIIGWVAQYGGASGVVGQVVGYLDFNAHLDNFYRGIIDLKDVVFFLSASALALFMATMNVETRRWR